MVNQIRSDESLQVLVFVVLPLFLAANQRHFSLGAIRAALNREISYFFGELV